MTHDRATTIHEATYTPRGFWWHRFMAACVLAISNWKLRRCEGDDYDSWIEDIDRLISK